MSWATISLIVMVSLFSLYEIAHGYRQSRRYNLRFILIFGILTGLPFLAALSFCSLAKAFRSVTGNTLSWRIGCLV